MATTKHDAWSIDKMAADLSEEEAVRDGLAHDECGHEVSIFLNKWQLLHKIRMLCKITFILAASIHDGDPRKDGGLYN